MNGNSGEPPPPPYSGDKHDRDMSGQQFGYTNPAFPGVEHAALYNDHPESVGQQQHLSYSGQQHAPNSGQLQQHASNYGQQQPSTYIQQTATLPQQPINYGQPQYGQMQPYPLPPPYSQQRVTYVGTTVSCVGQQPVPFGQPTIPYVGQPTIPYVGQPTIPYVGQPSIPYVGQTTVPYIGQQPELPRRGVSDKTKQVNRVVVVVCTLTAFLLVVGISTNHWIVSPGWHAGLWNTCSGGFCFSHNSGGFTAAAVTFGLICLGVGVILNYIVTFTAATNRQHMLIGAIVMYAIAGISITAGVGVYGAVINGMFSVWQARLSWSFVLVSVVPFSCLVLAILISSTCAEYSVRTAGVVMGTVQQQQPSVVMTTVNTAPVVMAP